ncbi:hypothetical protein MAP00_009299 [Monascus purpureus]|nr:hypothetical protein MAP00_009299 [Monascus purpureus]
MVDELCLGCLERAGARLFPAAKSLPYLTSLPVFHPCLTLGSRCRTTARLLGEKLTCYRIDRSIPSIIVASRSFFSTAPVFGLLSTLPDLLSGMPYSIRSILPWKIHIHPLLRPSSHHDDESGAMLAHRLLSSSWQIAPLKGYICSL